VTLLTNFSAKEDLFRCFLDLVNECGIRLTIVLVDARANIKAANMNGRAMPGRKFNQLWTDFSLLL